MVLGLLWIWGCSGEVKPVEDGVKRLRRRKGFKEYESEFYEGEEEDKMGVIRGIGVFRAWGVCDDFDLEFLWAWGRVDSQV